MRIVDLNDCPFCGARPKIYVAVKGRLWEKEYFVYVACTKCSAATKYEKIKGNNAVEFHKLDEAADISALKWNAKDISIIV